MRAIALLPMLFLAAAPTALGQSPDTLPNFTLTGRVLDYRGDTPVPGALVQIQELDRRVIADSSGAFAFADLAPARYTFVTSRLGYVTNSEPTAVRPGYALVVRLVPQPIVLEGLAVTADRLESRRKALGSVSWVDTRPVLATSAASSVAQLLQWRHHLFFSRCPRDSFGMSCAWVRGRFRRLRLYIDDVPAAGGAGMLYGYRPSELHRVEVYPGLGMIRIYTPWFIERVAKNGGSLEPLCIVC